MNKVKSFDEYTEEEIKDLMRQNTGFARIQRQVVALEEVLEKRTEKDPKYETYKSLLHDLYAKRDVKLSKMGIRNLRSKITEERRLEKLETTILKLKQRYQRIFEIVEEIKPKTIVEIGTCSGKTARGMIYLAEKHNENVLYIGYDLFEDLEEDDYEFEYNGKKNASLAEVDDFLMRFKTGNDFTFNYDLRKGNTNEILEEHEVDLVFIDGGHSVETIENDFSYVKNSKVIIFDDYYLDEDVVDISEVGCNTIVDQLPSEDVDIFYPDDDQTTTIAIYRNPDWNDE